LAVPIVLAIDEHGIVRVVRPRPDALERDFVNQTFAEDAPAAASPERYGPIYPPPFEALQSAAQASQSANDWRAVGDAQLLWGGPGRLDASIDAYASATRLDPHDRCSWFRFGVALRRRYETSTRHDNDFQAAVENWGRALALDPNQYIWRRRIQQYGPRLDKPYSFYDWVPQAEEEIRQRGDRPVQLLVRPGGAEFAAPAKTFVSSRDATAPDPTGRVTRIHPPSVRAEVTVVPRFVAPGKSARVHVVIRVDASTARLHWNNEAEPLRLWLDPPAGWIVSERLLAADNPSRAVSAEDRRIEFEVQSPAGAATKGTIAAYAVFHVCDESGGTCRFARLDIPIDVPVDGN
jgi:hypothetical protein